MVFFSLWWHKWWFGVERLGALNAYAKTLPDTGPYNAVELGMLKQLDQMVDDLHKPSGTQAHLTLLLRQKAMAALPEDTATVLRNANVSSDIALELVRRDMTKVSQLAATLYGCTTEDLEKDPALKKIHDRLSKSVELYGVLTLAGITPTERKWAQALVDGFGDLRSLRATPWSEVSWLLGLIELSPDKKEQTDREKEEQGLPVTGDSKNTYENPPTRTELRIIKELFSVGEGAPAIRAQVLSYRMSLDVADELEEMGIHDASQITSTDQRRLLLAAQQRVEEREAEEAAAEKEAEELAAAGNAQDQVLGDATLVVAGARQLLVDKAPQGQTSRAIPAFAAAATKILPVAAKALPKLGTSSKLTSIVNGRKSGLNSLAKNMNAMKANAKSAQSSSGDSNATAANAKSGLYYPKPEEIDQFSSTVNSATGAVQSVKGLYKELTPDIEAQVAAIEQEKARLNESLDYVRAELEKVDVSGQAADSLQATRAALERAKAQVAPDPNFGRSIAEGSALALQQSLVDQRLVFGGPVGLGSYASNEELVAKASGGVAMYGINYFPTDEDIVLKPYAPLLQNPEFVEMTGAVSPFEAQVEKMTSQSRAEAFHNTSSNAGISVARTVSSSKGASASAGFLSVAASGSAASATSASSSTAVSTETSSSATEETFTASATIIEYIRCPMKSFRIPLSQMDLTPDAFEAAVLVDTIEKGEEFLDNYGSHVSTGRQELGGIFFSTISLTTQKRLSEVSMMSAASAQSESIKNTSKTTQAGGGGSFLGFGAKASSSYGKATSTGRVTVKASSEGSGTAEAEEEGQYENFIRCVGPNTTTPEDFAEALFTDTSTWAVTDRGRLEAMVPVTDLLEKTYKQIAAVSPPDPNKKKLEIAILFVKAAWRRRAKRWGFLLNTNLDVPTPLLNLLKSAFPTSLGRVPTLLTALLNSLIIKHTDAALEAKEPELETLRSDVAKLAKQIVAAAEKAQVESNSFPVELSYLDGPGVEKQVTKEITSLGNENSRNFEAIGLTYDLDTDSYRFNVNDIDAPEKTNQLLWDGKAVDGSKAWVDLEEWQRRWINQNREQEGVWSQEDYQLFQRRYFAEDQSGGEFVKHLEGGLEKLDEDNAITFFTAVLSDREAKKTALQRAVSGMLRADWVVLRDLWFEDEKNPGVFDDDELGPEGESLWSKILAGIGLFQEVKDAERKEKELSAEMEEEFPDVDLKSTITDGERDADNERLASLGDAVEKATEAVEEGKEDGVDGDEAEKREKALQAARKALSDYRNQIDRKATLRSQWNAATAESQRAARDYLASFPDE